ncbi:MAG: GGDEF domain-containing protein [Pseudomonadota bacterium]
MGSGLYRALDFGPLARSYAGKLTVAALLAMLPLAGAAVVVGLAPGLDSVSTGLLLTAGLVASICIAALGIRSLVKPLKETAAALDDFANSKALPQLPTDGRDELGQVMAHAQKAVALLDDVRRQRSQDRTTDPITGLINQRSAIRRLGQDILRASRDERPLCAALIEIDNMDALQQQYPQGSLDKLVTAVSNLIVNHVRRSDWVASHGNHKFLAGLWGVESEAARTALGRVATALKNNRKQPITLSIGIAAVKGDQSPDTVIANATNALYKARQQGGGRTIVEG